MSALISYEVADGVCVLTMNRPGQRNAVNAGLARELRQALARFEADPAAQIGILAGRGKVFCAGMDLKAFADGEADEILFGENRFAGIADADRKKPLIAAVQGAALAGGLEIALACDLIVAEQEAVFGLTEVKVGIFAVAGGPFRLAKRIPPARALELALTGGRIGATEARDLGLVNRIAPPGKLMDTARQLAAQIAENAPLGIAATLAIVRSALRENEAQLFRLSEDLWAGVAGSHDAREGPAAFAEKRRPGWTGT
ncbi:enoyl-CoA hydratase/isomerase family protein [Leisingera daeponensis]|uniref:Enoyl-CoA hydratase/isomerase family protein n=1 Tax=Leisingera daeponensis TaxID=405746 RepID=A0ABS7NLV4_9RHOB|nr:enoyl-CoA hydratase-related protein [Leisingera daeponensis]MBY6142180.1 enoyl-CoA hydratase/isomerase family protein [Leisingera daeponensis]